MISSPKSVTVRVQFSSRQQEALEELERFVGRRSHRQGTDASRIWDFATREQANLFTVNAVNTPGVARVEVV